MIILVDPLYNPNFRSAIESSTPLGPGITVAKFIGAPGTPSTMQDYKGSEFQLARNLYLQAEAMRIVHDNKNFNSIRLVPTDVQTNGQIVGYQVVGKDGNVDIPQTFDVAEFWKDYINFEKIQLWYDHFNPDGSLSVSILLHMPSVPESFDVSFSGQIETLYNNYVQATNELVEFS